MSASPVHDMLILLRQSGDRLSRNRHFELFQDPVARRALRLHLMLARLERDLVRYASQRGTEVNLRAGAERPGARLEIVVPALRLRRSVYLGEVELELLRESAAINELLDRQRTAGPDADMDRDVDRNHDEEVA